MIFHSNVSLPRIPSSIIFSFNRQETGSVPFTRHPKKISSGERPHFFLRHQNLHRLRANQPNRSIFLPPSSLLWWLQQLRVTYCHDISPHLNTGTSSQLAHFGKETIHANGACPVSELFLTVLFAVILSSLPIDQWVSIPPNSSYWTDHRAIGYIIPHPMMLMIQYIHISGTIQSTNNVGLLNRLLGYILQQHPLGIKYELEMTPPPWNSEWQ